MDDMFGDMKGVMPMFSAIMMFAVVQSMFTPTTPAKTLVSITVVGNASQVAGSTEQLSVVGTYSDGSTENITSSATWSSSDNSIATVDAYGVLSAIAAGTATITAFVGLVQTTFGITVTTPASDRIIIDIDWD